MAIFSSILLFSQNTINTNASASWTGYVNVFDLSNAYLWGSAWGVSDLKTEIDKIIAEIVESGEYNTYLEEAAKYTVVE